MLNLFKKKVIICEKCLSQWKNIMFLIPRIMVVKISRQSNFYAQVV